MIWFRILHTHLRDDLSIIAELWRHFPSYRLTTNIGDYSSELFRSQCTWSNLLLVGEEVAEEVLAGFQVWRPRPFVLVCADLALPDHWISRGANGVCSYGDFARDFAEHRPRIPSRRVITVAPPG